MNSISKVLVALSLVMVNASAFAYKPPDTPTARAFQNQLRNNTIIFDSFSRPSASHDAPGYMPEPYADAYDRSYRDW